MCNRKTRDNTHQFYTQFISLGFINGFLLCLCIHKHKICSVHFVVLLSASFTHSIHGFSLDIFSHGNSKQRFGSVTNLSVNPEISNKISQARSLFGGSAFSLNKVNDRPLTPYRHASSATDLTNDKGDSAHHNSNHSNSDTNQSNAKLPTKTVIKTPIKFTDELQVITQNNEPAKKSTFGYIFKNFFK